MVRYYINLTAGLEHLFSNSIKTYSNIVFVRIQSSHIEQKAWGKLFYALPDDLLLNLAMGTKCIILDASSNCGGNSKVLRIGIPVIKYILNRLWFGVEFKPKNMDSKYLERVYRMLNKETKQKLRYFKKFLKTKEIKLEGIGLCLEKEETDLIIQKFKEEFDYF